MLSTKAVKIERPPVRDQLLNLSAYAWQRGDFHEAQIFARAGLSAAPRDAAMWANLAGACRDAGEQRQAREAYTRALELDVGFVRAASGRLFSLLLDDEVDSAAVWQAHMAWGREFPASRTPRAATGPAGRLKVGYVSADFRTHSVAEFIEPILGAHTDAIEVICYYTGKVVDEVTHRLAAVAGNWKHLPGAHGAHLATEIGKDDIQVLVDLGGHTYGNSLSALSQWPAPVQVGYLGYPHATGVAQMGRIGDARADREIVEDGLETVPCMWAFAPPWPGTQSTIPSAGRGYVTYGVFRPPGLWNATMLGIWAELLVREPRARLVLKGRGGGDALVAARVLGAFARAGVAERVALLPMVASQQDHLAALGSVDVILDTWPWSGTTTTCEALWSGVPVVALDGDVHYRRTSSAILHHAGQPQLVAGDPDMYLEIARQVGADEAWRATYRREARDRMRASPLMDYQARAMDLEAAYRRLWEKAR